MVTNRFLDAVAPYFDPYYSRKIVQDLNSSAIPNPYLGELGGLHFFGGTTGASNDNSVIGLVLGQNSMSFVRLADPTPYFGRGTDPTTQWNNSTGAVGALLDETFGDYAVGDQWVPGAHSTYGHGGVLPPSAGGAVFGTFFAPFAPSGNGQWGGPHVLQINSLVDPGLNVWARASPVPLPHPQHPPAFSAYSPNENRSYYMSRNLGASARWFDHSSSAWGTTAQPGLNVGDADDPDSGVLILVPERGMLIGIVRKSGFLSVQYSDLSGGEPASPRAAELSMPLVPRQGGPPSYATWHAAFWCPDNQRLILGNVLKEGLPDSGAVYEVEIPTTATDPWPVTRQPFSVGSLVWPEGTWQNFSYLPRVKAALVMFKANDLPEGPDTVHVFRPHGT